MADLYAHSTHKSATIVGAERNISKICSSRYSKDASLALYFLDFFVKHFPNYLSLHYEKLFFVDNFEKNHILKQEKCMAVRLGEQQSDLRLK